MYVCMYVCVRACVRAYVHACVHACVCVYVCMYVCMHVCMHPCVYVRTCMCMCRDPVVIFQFAHNLMCVYIKSLTTPVFQFIHNKVIQTSVLETKHETPVLGVVVPVLVICFLFIGLDVTTFCILTTSTAFVNISICNNSLGSINYYTTWSAHI
jgi:hypothetical protein